MKTKNLITTTFICLTTTLVFCQKTQIDNKVEKQADLNAIKSDSSDIETNFIEINDSPIFPGGETKLYEFINKNINKEIVSSTNLKEGNVLVSFHIDTVGKLDNFRIVKSYNQTIDSEFLRVLKLMPNWKPGRRLINGTKGPWVKSAYDWHMPLKIPYKKIKTN